MSNFRWAVTPLTRRSVSAALLAPRLKSTKAITMPERTMIDMMDEQCGIPHDSVAQQRAEEAIRAAISYRLRADAKPEAASIQAVEVSFDDESIAIRNVPSDVLEGITAELHRIAHRPARV